MNKSIAKIAFYAYLAGAFCYAVYGMVTESGLPGYFTGLQLDWFGRASLKLSTALALAAMYLPAYPAAAFLRRIGVFRKDEAIVGLQPQPQRGAARPMSLRTVMILAIAPSAIAIPAYFIATAISDHDRTLPIRQMDLGRSLALPAADAKFVEMKAAMQMELRYQLTRKTASSGARHIFAPLTPFAWKAREPVVYFIDTTIDEDWAMRLGGARDNRIVLKTFEGRLVENGLPSFVRQEYEREGIRIASPHFVLERMHFHDGKIPDVAGSRQYHLIWVLGLLVSLAILVGGLVGIGVAKLRARRATPT